ncbi:serine/threonine-protein phosphatase 7 long form homolog [Gossypium hirsutum]|uniref:Serine/threonine-protein phosphatase 7 long form homolog n=1 Tax=Gossypium hirsutum TaxID=3635 RepID=A0A1U8HNG9_GOSHI|nr:serine/threonine-protein phosphatase 7 long form homolog [Gossypium hirsutum]
MVGSLIFLDNKHISVNQLQMVEDRILQCHIHNLPGPPSPLIETYLRETSSLHVTLVGWACKLDLKLISVLVERWRPNTHTFHLLCGECTIQLGLPVDVLVVSGFVQSLDWGTIYYDLLGVVLETIYGGQIKMVWLQNNFAELAEDSTQERNATLRCTSFRLSGVF